MIVAIDLNPVDDVIDGVGDLIGGAAYTAGQAGLDLVVAFVFGLIADAVAALTTAVVQTMNATTSVDLSGGFFPEVTPIRQTVLGMAAALVLALFFVAIIRALAAGEPAAIVRAALVDVPAAMLTTVVSVTVAWILIRVVDQASLAVTGDVGTALGEFTASLSLAGALPGAGLLGIIFGLLFVLGAILVWLQLLVRSALIYILIVLAPLGFATRAHPSTRQIARRTIEMGIALILSKFGVAVAFGVGASAVESSNGVGAGESADLSGMMTGVAVMLMAAFMPWVIWKVIPVIEGATAAAGVERSPVRGAVSAGSMAVAVGMGAGQLAGSRGVAASGGATGLGGIPFGGSTGGAPGGASPAGGPSLPGQPNGGGSGTNGGRAAMTPANPSPGGVQIVPVETAPAPAVATVPSSVPPSSGGGAGPLRSRSTEGQR